MSDIKHTVARSAFFMPYGGGTQGMFRFPMPAFAPEDGGGNDDSEDKEDDTPEDKKEEKPARRSRRQENSDVDVTKLVRDLAGKTNALEKATSRVNELEAQVKRFEGIDPEAVKALLEEKEKAEEDRKKAEEERLKAAGDFDTLRKRMADEHDKAIKAEQAKLVEAQKQIEALQKQIYEGAINVAFASSEFLRENTILPPSKARRAYEDYFEVKDGVLIGYDRPADEDERVPLVDARGKPLPFDVAIKQIIENDPDRDHILKSTRKSGSGQAPGKGGKEENNDKDKKELRGVSAIAAALAAKKLAI